MGCVHYLSIIYDLYEPFSTYKSTGSVLEHRQIKLLFLDRLTARYTKPDWTPYWTTPLKTTTEFVFVKECELAKMQLILNVDLDFLTDHHLLSS